MIANPKSSRASFRLRLELNKNVEYRRQLRRIVMDALERGERRIEVDCSSWTQLDLILLSALVDCAKACHERGVDFQLDKLGSDIELRIRALQLGKRMGLQ